MRRTFRQGYLFALTFTSTFKTLFLHETHNQRLAGQQQVQQAFNGQSFNYKICFENRCLTKYVKTNFLMRTKMLLVLLLVAFCKYNIWVRKINTFFPILSYGYRPSSQGIIPPISPTKFKILSPCSQHLPTLCP